MAKLLLVMKKECLKELGFNEEPLLLKILFNEDKPLDRSYALSEEYKGRFISAFIMGEFDRTFYLRSLRNYGFKMRSAPIHFLPLSRLTEIFEEGSLSRASLG